jgi:hypothetical protein
MASLIAGIMLVALAGSAPAPAPDGTVCDWMSGASQAAHHPYFAKVAADQERGDFERASAGFASRSEQLSKLAEKSCFEAHGATLEETEKFLEHHVRGEQPLLFARRDQWAFSTETVAWGAWLACRNGQTDVAKRLLLAGWRDWADSGLLVDASLLLLANGKAEQATDFLDEKSITPAGLVAMALFNCRTGKPEDGLKWLDKALVAASDEPTKARVKALRKGCGK